MSIVSEIARSYRPELHHEEIIAKREEVAMILTWHGFACGPFCLSFPRALLSKARGASPRKWEPMRQDKEYLASFSALDRIMLASRNRVRCNLH